jgi:CHAT domain-containing protein/Tfp pilus assembly protein PilF
MSSMFAIADLNRMARACVVMLAGFAAVCWLLPEPPRAATSPGNPSHVLNRCGRAVSASQSGSLQSEPAFESGPAKTSVGRTSESEAQDASSGARQTAEKLLSEAAGLWGKGTAESRRQAIEKYRAALGLLNAMGDHSQDAATLNSIGSIHQELGENSKALEFFNQALAAAETIHDLKQKAAALSNAANIYDIFGNKLKAIQAYDLALSVATSIPDRAVEAGVLNDAGLVYWSLGNLQKSLDFFTHALSIRQEIGDRNGQSTTLHNLGVIHSSMAEYGKALQYYDQALSIERELGLNREEARTLNNIGVAYAAIDEYQKAFHAYDQALPLRRATGDRRGEAYTLSNLGDLRACLGDHEDALRYYDQALPIAREVGDKQLECSILSNQGWACAMLGQYSKALECYQQGLALSRLAGVRRIEGEILEKLGIAYSAMGDNDKALDYYRNALALSRAVGNRVGEASCLTNTAATYLAQGKTGQALDYYLQAASIERSTGPLPNPRTLSGMARAQASAGNLAGALQTMESALTAHESARRRVPSLDLRASSLSYASAYYDQYIDLLMRQHSLSPSSGYDALALQASERGRARSLVESLRESGADIKEGIDHALLSKQQDIQRRLSEKEAYRARLLAGPHDNTRIASLDKELDQILDQLHEVQAEIRVTSPRYAALTQPSPLSVGEIQRQLLDDNTMLLEYSLGADRSFLWAITPDSVSSFELRKRSEINAAARRAYELLNESGQRIHRSEAEAALAQLSQMVLEPVKDLLGHKRLLIVPDAALLYVPFEALPEPVSATAPTVPLIAGHEVTYLPSASVLAELRRATVGRVARERTVAVLADPVFGPNDPRVSRPSHRASSNERARPRPLGEPPFKPDAGSPPQEVEQEAESEVLRSISETGGALERLPFARREAQAILHLSDNRGLAALDFKANRATAMSPELERYRVIHFATHAVINSRHPDLSGIVLSLVDQQGRPQNGFLAAHDIYNLKLRADLVVLSACRTALGKELKGEGLVSIVRGFMYAGAPRIVATLWDVRDQAAAELMKRFYHGFLIDGLAPAAALRAAKVSMLKEKQWESPYYWAGFVLQGEWK